MTVTNVTQPGPQPVVIWTDKARRLVLIEGETAETNQYFLEYKEGDNDALGQARWVPYPLNWDVFRAILKVAHFDPIVEL